MFGVICWIGIIKGFIGVEHKETPMIVVFGIIPITNVSWIKYLAIVIFEPDRMIFLSALTTEMQAIEPLVSVTRKELLTTQIQLANALRLKRRKEVICTGYKLMEAESK